MVETVDSDPPLYSILLKTRSVFTSVFTTDSPTGRRGRTYLDCDVGQPAVLNLLVVPVVVEVAPVLPVTVPTVAVLELHAPVGVGGWWGGLS